MPLDRHCVRIDVSGNSENSTFPKHTSQSGDAFGCEKSPVSLRVLGPWVGKEDPDLVERRCDDSLDEDECVPFDDSKIGELVGVDIVEKSCDSRTMYVH